MADWLVRAGLTLQFLSLWLVTPQIIGETRMMNASRAIRKRLEGYTDPDWPSLKSWKWMTLVAAAVSLIVVLAYFGPVGVSWDVFVVLLVALIAVVAWPVGIVMTNLVWLTFAGLALSIDLSTRSARGLLIAGAGMFTAGFGFLLSATWVH